MIDPLARELHGFEGHIKEVYLYGKHVRLVCNQNWDSWALSMTPGWKPNALTETIIQQLRQTDRDGEWRDLLMDSLRLNVAGVSLDRGYRVFRPTVKQCASLMPRPLQPAKDFGLPYEAFYIVIPPEFSKTVEDKRREKTGDSFNAQASYIGLCRSPVGALMYLKGEQPRPLGICPVVLPRPENPFSIGDVIDLHTDDDPYRVVEMQSIYWRIAINACFALTHYGRVGGYIDPEANRRHRQAARRNRDNDMLPRMDARRILLKQELVDDLQVPPPRPIFEDAPPPQPTGRRMPYHIRKGHWHTYWTGPGRQVPIRKLLKETAIHPEDFLLGESPDTDIKGKD